MQVLAEQMCEIPALVYASVLTIWSYVPEDWMLLFDVQTDSDLQAL